MTYHLKNKEMIEKNTTLQKLRLKKQAQGSQPI